MAKKRIGKKKSSLSKVTKRAAKRKRSNPAPASSSKGVLATIGLGDIVEPVGVGVGAYAGTRLLGRIAYRLARRKSTRLAKHVGPWTSVLVALVATYSTRKSKRLERYETPVVIGSWIAALQGLLQTYFPRWGWILNDYHMDDLPLTAPATTSNGQKTSPTPEPTNNQKERAALLEDYIEIDEAGTSPPEATDDDDFSDIPGLSGGLRQGIFSGGLN